MNVGVYPRLFLLFAAGAVSCTAQSREQSSHVQAASAPRGDTSGASASLAEAERRRAALTPVTVEGQPLAANIQRVVEALDFLGAPLPAESAHDLLSRRSGPRRDRLQELLDPAGAARGAHQSGGAGESGARTGAGRAAAGRIHRRCS